MPQLPKKPTNEQRESYNAYFREYRLKNLEKLRAYKREYNKQWRKEHGYHNEEKWTKNHPTQVKAQQAVYRARVSGKVKKYWCEVCHSLNVVAHHDDYRKPLEVRWLCRSHHRAVHYGNNNGLKVIHLTDVKA